MHSRQRAATRACDTGPSASHSISVALKRSCIFGEPSWVGSPGALPLFQHDPIVARLSLVSWLASIPSPVWSSSVVAGQAPTESRVAGTAGSLWTPALALHPWGGVAFSWLPHVFALTLTTTLSSRRIGIMQASYSVPAANLRLSAAVCLGIALTAATSAWPQAVINPTAPDLTSPAAAGEPTEGYEVLMRGPLHEAFASPIRETGEGDYIELPSPPPEPIAEQPAEMQPRTSNQEAEWIPGYWGVEEESGDLCWISGTWRFAPPGRRWLPGYWADNGGTSVWVSGSWIDAQTTTLQYLPEPPPLREEWQPTSTAPTANHFWIPGQWVWQASDYQWRDGFWSRGYDDWVWVPAHYLWTPGGYVYVTGYWDYQPRYRGVVFAPIQVYPSYYRSLAYRPSFAINLGLSLAHLFVRPSYRHYYFGNYYGPAYSRLGFYPWTGYRRGLIYYDPLYVYFSLHRAGSLREFFNWHERARLDDRYRPPRFYDRDRDRFEDRNGDERPRTARLVQPADTLLAETGFRTNRLSEPRRQQLGRDLEDLGDFTRRRAELETRRTAELRREGGSNALQPGRRAELHRPGETIDTDGSGAIDLRQLGRWGASRFGRQEARSDGGRVGELSDGSGRIRAQRSAPTTGWPERRETLRRSDIGPSRFGERSAIDSFRSGNALGRSRSSLEQDRRSQLRPGPREPSFARPELRQFAPTPRRGLESAPQRSFGRTPGLGSQGAAPRQRAFNRSSEGGRGRSGSLGGGRLQRGGDSRGGGLRRGRRD